MTRKLDKRRRNVLDATRSLPFWKGGVRVSTGRIINQKSDFPANNGLKKKKNLKCLLSECGLMRVHKGRLRAFCGPCEPEGKR